MVKFLLGTTAIVVCVATAAWAVVATGNADAIIKKALSATENTHMNFATIQTPPAGGTVTISPAGAVTTAASGFTFSGTPTAGDFTLSGDNSTALVVSFTNGSLTGPGTAMALQNFTSTPAVGSVSTGAGGTVTLKVGGDLIVGTSQTSGTYAGTYQVTVSY